MYAPMPTNAEYPSDTCPANPPRRFQAAASTTKNAMFHRSFRVPRSAKDGASRRKPANRSPGTSAG